ncbi:MAG: hypothetical protein ACR2KI_02515 [Candidatus Limnocylindria bacterium]|nr:MAG: hypothetical protein DLM71_01530 [Chloroflexota bacterium]
MPRIRPVRFLVVTILSLSVAACGGSGSGAGAGGGKANLHLLVVNSSQSPVTVTYSGGEPLSTSQDKPKVEKCTAARLDYLLKDPFQVSVDGKQVFDSSSLPAGLPQGGATDVTLGMTVAKDGKTTVDQPIGVGKDITKPAALGICY